MAIFAIEVLITETHENLVFYTRKRRKTSSEIMHCLDQKRNFFCWSALQKSQRPLEFCSFCSGSSLRRTHSVRAAPRWTRTRRRLTPSSASPRPPSGLGPLATIPQIRSKRRSLEGSFSAGSTATIATKY